MAFVTEKEELKPGLILFRRGDVDHRMWYCRMKMPKADRYKTVSLKTSDREAARERAFDQDADVRFRIKHDVPVFNRPFRDVAHEYLLMQEARAKRGEISAARPKKLRAVIEGTLDRYAVPRRSTLSVMNDGAAIRHGDGRTARDATGAMAFGKSQPQQLKPLPTMKRSAALRFNKLWASGF